MESAQSTQNTEQKSKIPSSFCKLEAPVDKQYIIEIPENVESIIRRYIALLPHNEWSGVLFYTVEGDFDAPVLKIICQDILLMDIGEGAHTQFTTERMIGDYMADKPELLDCYNGLIHSHHVMGAFFSGEDTGTLHQEGINRNNFVSLVVDTRGTYVAAITRRVEVNTVYTPQSTAFYPFFSQRNVPMRIEREPEAVQRVRHVVQCFPLTVVRHTVDVADEYTERFAGLLKQMLVYSNRTPQTPAVSNYQSFKSFTKQKKEPESTPPVQTPSYTPGYSKYVEEQEEETVYTPRLPFPGEQEQKVEEDLDDWGLAIRYKPIVWFNRPLFESWLVTLFSGTPLVLLTENIRWTTQMAERILDSWRESLNQEQFEEFCTSWIPLCVSMMNQKDYFEENVLNNNPELDEFTLGNIFFLHLRDVFTNDLNYDVYTETIFDVLKMEFDYPSE